MSTSVEQIQLSGLILAFLPTAAVVFIFVKWKLPCHTPIYALSRMLVQLLLIGYVLVYIFKSDTPFTTLLVLGVMIFSSSWIALRTVKDKRRSLYWKCLGSIFAAGTLTLLLVTQGVLHLSPWYYPRYFIPLAGMIFANSMNAVSLAADRAAAELKQGVAWDDVRAVSLRASLIPVVNACFAVGLVSIPGMMTGQILSGISPLLAARYQIVVMCMILGSAGTASASFLHLAKHELTEGSSTSATVT